MQTDITQPHPVYKVVYNYEGTLYPAVIGTAWANHKEGHHNYMMERFKDKDYEIVLLKYRANKITRPKIGKIFCFSTLSSAQSFREAIFGNEVWSALAYEPEKIRKHLAFTSCFEIMRNIKLWLTNPESIFTNARPCGNAFSNGLLCKAIKLLERVD